MHTINMGNTKFHFNSDLSGNLIIRSGPIIEDGEVTTPPAEIEVPAEDVVQFVLYMISKLSADEIIADLENYDMTGSVGGARDMEARVGYHAHVIKIMRDMSDSYGHGASKLKAQMASLKESSDRLK